MKYQREHLLGVPAYRDNRAGTGNISTGSSRVTALDRLLIGQLAKAVGSPAVHIALWDGKDHYVPADASNSAGRVIFRDRGALISTITSMSLGFGDAYSAGRIDIEGDLVNMLCTLYRAMIAKSPESGTRGLFGRLPKPRSNTRDGSRKNVHHHYDLGNDFYRLWLDENMVYTCAYYPSRQATLEEAQIAKMDHVCRKVLLAPGMHVVEAGCGWGSLALHMAEHYGVRVTAYNISQQQIVVARERAQERGLADRVEFVEDDYRNISGNYDAFVSVGMLEHVGKDNYRTLGDVVRRSLKPEGLGIIHSVGRTASAPPNAWLEQRIFPGSYPPSLREMMTIFEPHGLSILDVENLRIHYAETLNEWLRRFDDNVNQITAMYDEPFVRAWRLYLGGCAASFLTSSLQLFQVVFSHPENNRIPMTRSHVYGQDSPHWDL